MFQNILKLMLTFGKLGALTFGGGYAMIALMEEEVIHKHHWLTSEEVLNIITIAESTPGPIAVNMATFVGYRVAGLWGGLLTTLALIFPAWLCIVILSFGYSAFKDNLWIASALAGIRIAAIVLIAKAFMKMGKNIQHTVLNGCVFGLTFIAALVFNISAIYLILGGLIYGLIWHGIIKREPKP